MANNSMIILMKSTISALAVLAALLGACSPQEDAAEIPRPAVAVARGPLVYASSFFGELKAASSQAIHAPELSGVEYLTVETVLPDGTRVKKDDVVLTFAKGPLEDNLRSDQTELDVTEAELQKTTYDLEQERVRLELDVKRKQMAVERAELFVVEGVNLISRLDLDKYRLDVSKAKIELDLASRALRAFTQKRTTALEIKRLRVDAARRKVEEKRAHLTNMEVKAPAEGMLYGPYTRLNWVRGKVAVGSVCRPGDKLLEIPDLSAYEAEIFVRQRDASLLEIGAQATLTPSASPDMRLKATVSARDDFATTRNERLGTELPENNLKEIRVVLKLEEAPEVLRPGGTARVDVEIVLSEAALLVPLAAVTDEAGQSFVTLESGQRKPVKLGRSSTVMAEVLEGLSEGDRVLLGAASPASPAALAPDTPR